MTEAKVSPQADLEKAKDRFSAWQIGVLAATTALVGAFIGGLFSYFAAVHTSDSQAKQNQEQFLVQQRQVSYAKLTADVKSNSQYFLDCSSGQLYLNKDLSARLSVQIVNKTNALSAAVSTDAASVVFVSGGDAGEYAEALDLDFQNMAASCQEKTILSIPSKAEPKPDPSKAHGNQVLKKSLIHESSDLSNFIAYGRIDISGN